MDVQYKNAGFGVFSSKSFTTVMEFISIVLKNTRLAYDITLVDISGGF